MTPITLSHGALRADILPLGATLAGLWHRDHGHSLVLGYADPNDHLRAGGYLGALVGPIANRVGGARILVDGVAYELDANEGPNTLHSGPVGVHSRMWTCSDISPRCVILTLQLPHLACGLPGERTITACYTLSAPATLRLEMTAISDRTTVMNLAHHPYWNLSGAGDIRGHRLCVHADSYLPTTDAKLPTGARAPIKDLGLAAHRAVPLRGISALDHCVCLGSTRHAVPRHAATLEGPNGLRMHIETTEPGLQLYDGARLEAMTGTVSNGAAHGPYAGLAIEAQGWPDAPNHPDFPQIMLQAGHTYRQIVEYRLD